MFRGCRERTGYQHTCDKLVRKVLSKKRNEVSKHRPISKSVLLSAEANIYRFNGTISLPH